MKKIVLFSLLFMYLNVFSQQLLSTHFFNNGEAIPEAKTASEWEQLSMSNQPVFMKKVIDGTEYYFYNWYSVSDIRGIVNEKWMIPNQTEIVIWNAYSPIEISPIGIVSELGAFTKVSDQQYYWTTSEYNEKGKRESAVSVSIYRINIGETELKHAYKQEGFLVLVIENEKMKLATKSVAQSILNNNKIPSQIASPPTTIEKQNVTSNNPIVTISSSKPNKPYNSVKIGNQTWMTENLNVDRFRNGDLIPEAKSVSQWEQAGKNKQPAWCYYNNDPANGKKYGKLYNWYAVNDSRGLAPHGWHIPSDKEWTILSSFLGGDIEAGNRMKSDFDWDYDGNGNNSSGFSGLPGGFCFNNGFSINIGNNGVWWSSSQYNESNAINCDLYSINSQFFKRNYNKGFGFSVRCLKD
jgi:uncharacterized protein (TIGR02145 family)